MIDINASFFIQLGLFWFVIIIMNTMFFKPMLKYLDYRKALITGRKEEAEKVMKGIEDKERYYADRVRDARDKGIEFKKSVRDEIVKAQKEQTDQQLRKLDDEFSKQRNIVLGEAEAARGDMAKAAGDLSRVMASKILGRDVQ